MRRKLMAVVIALSAVGAMPLPARGDDAPKSYDGRLDDFVKPVTLDNGGTALTYFIWVGLSVVAVLVLFKDAKRSHLD